jgi:hypothetical protein
MEWQAHSIGIQEAIALFTFDEPINVVPDFAFGKYWSVPESTLNGMVACSN